LKANSCQAEWPENGEEFPRCVVEVRNIIRNARHLKKLSLGCLVELCEDGEELIYLLAEHQASNIEALHIASIKEDPDSYPLYDFPVDHFCHLSNLCELGLDYDYVTDELLQTWTRSGCTTLHKLILHVHGIEPEHPHVTNKTWQELVRVSPSLKVTLNLIHSIDGVENILDILQPALPVACLRMFFCQYLPEAMLTFLSQHNSTTLESIIIVDGMTDFVPAVYETFGVEDPFVMLTWKCQNLKEFSLIGYDIDQDDVVAIARLKGNQLKRFEIPMCCISTIEVEEAAGVAWSNRGIVGTNFFTEVSKSLGRDWSPISDDDLHPAVTDMHADAETVYLHYLQNDQQ